MHPKLNRRTAIQAGAVGLLGLGGNHLQALRASDGRTSGGKACIYIFLSGGLAQQDSFDLKPDATDTVRGEFNPINTKTPGIQICEHLPMLADRSEHWALVRSLTHPTNGHTLGHYFMLTGRSGVSPGFKGDRQPRPSDWPSIASIVGDAVPRQNNNLPPSVVLPERLIHWSGGVIPGAYGGQMGGHRDPFFIEATNYGDPFWRGAYPEYTFYQLPKKDPKTPTPTVYQAPNLKLPFGMSRRRFDGRLELLKTIDSQRKALEESAQVERYDEHRQSAISLLASQEVRKALDVGKMDEKVQERYGKNSFGWSLLMAAQLVKAGVNLVQVNLGNNEAWDTHGDAFWRLRDKLFPPTDRAISALLDDLNETGLLDNTLIVMGGEFGRTPKISLLPEHYKAPGRDHWGAVQTLFFAGGGVRGGNVVGASDKIGGYPIDSPQKPENMAASIYSALGIPSTAAWLDEVERPNAIYNGRPIEGLLS
ncbi:MAG: DUF1501 domain-containing protein [Pirellulaceae bacterium]|jgi:hypothetical protein|nr:DUF1501 domain-containing protein [Pirellulaceae bacterium]